MRRGDRSADKRHGRQWPAGPDISPQPVEDLLFYLMQRRICRGFLAWPIDERSLMAGQDLMNLN
ncbi:hypothetical protein NKH82_00005 [Mesorhizobium sp. M0915]|uniref:hypothetical protein n=1 Tax=Mesorhizobium sp. M0915 TaxID=2957027 RepID=UPI0033357E02